MTETIRRGDGGQPVRDLQERLARLVAPELEADGRFDARTEDAVRRFQQARGLAADGVVGPETWRGLVEAGYRLGDRLLWHAAHMMRGDDVLDLQHRLNQLGFDAGAEDGIFGPETQDAVEEFQRNVGLAVDGVAGPATLEALKRLRRQHQSGGIAVRVREREWMRGLSARGIVGARVLVDPAHGPDDPGEAGPSGVREADVTWAVGQRLAAHLSARGAQALLSRGPRTTPSVSERAARANEQGVDIVLSIGANAHPTPHACGASTYYFGAAHFVSESGRRLAELVQDAVVDAGWLPDCRTHAMTWGILRETRMPAVVVEPGFISCPTDEARLAHPPAQDRLAWALSQAVVAFFETAPDAPVAAAADG